MTPEMFKVLVGKTIEEVQFIGEPTMTGAQTLEMTLCFVATDGTMLKFKPDYHQPITATHLSAEERSKQVRSLPDRPSWERMRYAAFVEPGVLGVDLGQMDRTVMGMVVSIEPGEKTISEIVASARTETERAYLPPPTTRFTDDMAVGVLVGTGLSRATPVLHRLNTLDVSVGIYTEDMMKPVAFTFEHEDGNLIWVRAEGLVDVGTMYRFFVARTAADLEKAVDEAKMMYGVEGSLAAATAEDTALVVNGLVEWSLDQKTIRVFHNLGDRQPAVALFTEDLSTQVESHYEDLGQNEIRIRPGIELKAGCGYRYYVAQNWKAIADQVDADRAELGATGPEVVGTAAGPGTAISGDASEARAATSSRLKKFSDRVTGKA